MKISVIFEALTGMFETDVNRAEKSLNKFSREAIESQRKMQAATEESVKKIAMNFAKVALAASASLATMTQAAINNADQIRDTSIQYGVGVETLSAYKSGLEQSGSSLNSFARGMKALAKEVISGGESLKAMGIDVRDASGEIKSQEQLISEIAGKFSGYADGIEKTALANKLFGKSGAELIPFLNEGSEALEALTQRAKDFGTLVDNDLANASDAWNDRLLDLKDLSMGFANDLARELLPVLNSTATLLVDNAVEARKMGGGLSVLSDALKVVISGGVVFKNTFEFILDVLFASFDTLSASADSFIALGKAIGGVAKAQYQFLSGDFSGAIETMQETIKSTGDAFQKSGEKIVAAGSAVRSGFGNSINDVSDALSAIWSPALDGAAQDAKDLADESNKARAPIIGVGNAAEQAAKKIKDADAHIKAWKKSIEEAQKRAAEAAQNFIRLQRDLSNEIGGPAAQALQRYNDALAITLEYEQTLSQISPAQVTAINQARIDALESYKKELEALDPVLKQQEENTRRFVDIATSGFNSMADAVGDFAVGAISSLSDLGKSFVNSIKSMVSQAISEFFKMKIIQPFLQNLFGGGGVGGAGGFNLSSIFSGLGVAGAQSGGFNFSSIISSLGGGGLSLFGGGAAAASAAGFGGSAIGSYGVAATATGTVGSAAVGGGLLSGSGLSTAFAGVPIIGWIAAAMALNNSLFSQGWRPNGGTISLRDSSTLSGGGSGIGRTLDTLARGTFLLGANLFGERITSILSGSAIITRLFGRKAPQFESQSTSFNFGANSGVVGTDNIIERGGIFRSDRRTSRTFNLDGEYLESLKEMTRTLEMIAHEVARSLDSFSTTMVDASIRTVIEFDKKGKEKVRKYFVDIAGRTWEEISIELAQTRLGAETIIAGIDAAFGSAGTSVGATVVENIIAGIDDASKPIGQRITNNIIKNATTPATGGEASAIAERWRMDAEKLMEGAQFLLLAATDIRNSTGLLGDAGTLTQITNLIEEVQTLGESLSDTYNRVVASTNLYQQAIGLSGVTLDKTREEFVRFAVDIVDAVGGLDRATELWQGFFEGFYSTIELAQSRANDAMQTAQQSLESLGLDSDITKEQFRAAFEAALPTLTPEQIASWLEAGEAMLIASDAASILAQAQERQTDAAMELSDMLSSLNASPLTDFGQDIFDINAQVASMTERANELAIASGRAGASQQELGEITEWASRQFVFATDRLRARVVALSEQLYGSELDRINIAIDAQQSLVDQANAANEEIINANAQRYQQELALIEGLKKYIDSLKLSALSPLNPQQQFLEATRQFESLFARAQRGDISALEQLQQSSQALLENASTFLGPSEQFSNLFNSILNRLGGIGVGSRGPGGAPPVVIVPSAELNDLFARREEILMQQEERNRAILAEALAIQIGELSVATSQSAVVLAQEMGINLATLIDDLGINLDELTSATTVNLADVASTLNLSVSQLANAVGANLGELTQTASLLNDAFEFELTALPDDIEANLRPLLAAVEGAVNEADANAALGVLRSAVDALAPSLRDELAPYVGLPPTFIEPITSLRDITLIQNDILNDILDAVREPQIIVEPPPLPPPDSKINSEQSSSLKELNNQLMRKMDDLINAIKNWSDSQVRATEKVIALATKGR